MKHIAEQSIEKFAVELFEKLQDTLLPKLMNGEVRVKLEEEDAGI